MVPATGSVLLQNVSVVHSKNDSPLCNQLVQIPETLPKEVLEKMHAPGPDTSVPEMDVHDLPNFDGFLIGFPTRWVFSAPECLQW